MIGTVVAGGVAAERAGLPPATGSPSSNGKPVDSWDTARREGPCEPGPAARRSRSTAAGATPAHRARARERWRRAAETIGRIGAAPQVDPEALDGILLRDALRPVEASARRSHKTWDMSIFSLRMLGKMIVGEVSWSNLSGPVTIADYAGQSAQLGSCRISRSSR